MFFFVITRENVLTRTTYAARQKSRPSSGNIPDGAAKFKTPKRRGRRRRRESDGNVTRQGGGPGRKTRSWRWSPLLPALPQPLFPVHFTCFRAIFLFGDPLSPFLSLLARLSPQFYLILFHSRNFDVSGGLRLPTTHLFFMILSMVRSR